jgi:hypothetical protein
MNLSDIWRQWIATAWENNQHPKITVRYLGSAQIRITERMDTTTHGLWWSKVELIVNEVEIYIGNFRAHQADVIPEEGIAHAEAAYKKLVEWGGK